MQNNLFLGIDIGSITIKTALFDAGKEILSETCTRLKGDPLNSLANELAALASKFDETRIVSAGITGSGRMLKQSASVIGRLRLRLRLRLRTKSWDFAQP